MTNMMYAETFIEKSPCLEHTVYLRVQLAGSVLFSVLFSDKTIYNKPSKSDYRFEDLYSGLMESEIVDNICRKKDNKISIPYPPEAIEECIKTRGDEVVGGDDIVKLVIQDPKGRRGRMPISSQIKNIPPCTVCKMSQTARPFVKSHNSSHLFVSWESMFKGCKFEVEDMEVVVDELRISRKITENRTLLVSRNPCVNHIIHIELHFRDPEKGALKSETTTYSAKETEHCTTSTGKPHWKVLLLYFLNINILVCYELGRNDLKETFYGGS